jgi:signal transduction histidine kinase
VLHEFLTTNTQEIIARTGAKVAARTSPVPTDDQLKNGVPLFLSQLIDRLRRATTSSSAIEESATLHGGELLGMGFSVSQVVHGYGDVCQVITQLADETDAPITADEFNVFNRCLDDAIAHSVTEYERLRDESVAYEGTERLGVLAHELRNRLTAAILSFTILKEGTVSIGGSTAVLGRSLRALRVLVNNALASVRMESGLEQRQRVSVAQIIGDAEVEATLGADISGFGLAVPPVAPDIEVDVDPQILSAAIGNLLQNAFKFSRRRGDVALRTTATDDRVLIEVEDECGGLPPGKAEELFRPFEQRSATRTGLGLGLSISRKAVETMGGALGVRDLPGKGCVFSIELPRLPAVSGPPRKRRRSSGDLEVGNDRKVVAGHPRQPQSAPASS